MRVFIVDRDGTTYEVSLQGDRRIVRCAVWDVTLTSAEMSVVAAGLSPLFVRPESLVFYDAGAVGFPR